MLGPPLSSRPPMAEISEQGGSAPQILLVTEPHLKQSKKLTVDCLLTLQLIHFSSINWNYLPNFLPWERKVDMLCFLSVSHM